MLIEWRLQPWSDRFHNIYIVALDTEKITAGRGTFGSFLVLHLDIKTYPESAIRDDDLFLLTGMIAGRDEQFYSALMIPAQTVGPNRMHVTVPINENQIEAIEEMRNGGPVEVQVHMSALGGIYGSLDGNNTEKVKTTAALHENNSWKYVKIEREKWIELLQRLGYGKRKLIEIPMPDFPKNMELWEGVISTYERVIAAERKGDFLYALQEGRKVVEGLKNVILVKWSLPEKGRMNDQLDSIRTRLIEMWGSGQSEKAKTLTSLIGAAWEYTSVSHHYGRTFMGERHEVKFVIELIAALFMYIGTLVEEQTVQ